MNMIPANIEHARLPQTYQHAAQALANCASIDECQDWADKAAALASYARQANDDQLEKMAMRIKARAVRRCGELLKQFDAQGKRTDQLDVGDHTKLSQREVAEQAGISKHQQVTAVRIANVQQEDFERAVESEKPPTITQLAQQGIKPRPLVDLKGRDPGDFNRALHYLGLIAEYARELRAQSHSAILPILTEKERNELRKNIAEIDSIHDMIATRI